MSANQENVFTALMMLAMSLTSSVVLAQDEIEDIGPAVDTSLVQLADVAAEEPDTAELEPAVDTSTSGNEITRLRTGNRVMDSIVLSRAEITGNQELPKVMYIVPWRRADPGDLMGRPVNTLLDEVLAPIDREEFLRQVDYYDDLYGDNQE